MADQRDHVMQQKLIIFLNTHDVLQSPYILSNEIQGVKKILTQGMLTSITAPYPTDITVVIPTMDVTLLQVALPKMNRQRLLQALPFAIEEQLLSDVNDLHFAVGSYTADGTLPVVIVAKQKMTAWLDALKLKNIIPSQLIPDVFLLPIDDASTCCICVFDNIAVFRSGEFSGTACDMDNAAMVMNTLQPKATMIQLYNYTHDAFSLPVGDANLVTVNYPREKLHSDFALWEGNSPNINLLQGEFRTRKQNTHSKKYWTLAGYLALATFSLSLISNGFFVAYFSHKNAGLETKIAKIYRSNFPNAHAVMAPKERLTNKLNQLRNGDSKNPLLTWLAILGKSLTTNTTIQLQQFSFQHDQLVATVTTDNFTSLDNFTQQISAQGLSAKQQNVVSINQKVKGEILIQAGHS